MVKPRRQRIILLFSLLPIVLAVLLLPAASYCAGREIITDFSSRIFVHSNGSLSVFETITVVAAGGQIKRGIYRDFPTRYRDRLGNTVQVDFSILHIKRDNQPSAYHTKDLKNGVRTYVGSQDVILRPGTYTYEIAYRTDRQLGFFDDFDELYWNVTGNDWDFPIQRARAVIELPPGAGVLRWAAYTGFFGARGKDFAFEQDELGNPGFTTTRALKPKEGLTIAVAWPRGFVQRPTSSRRLIYFLSDNRPVIISLLAVLVVLGYYLVAWLKVGRDPAEGTIIPRFTQPRGFSPASVRYVMRMGYDRKALAAAILNMAVKGYLTITERDDGKYVLARAGGADATLSKGEKAAAAKLFQSQSCLTLTDDYYQDIGAANKALGASLSTEYEKVYFFKNMDYFIPGIALTILFVAAQVLSGRDSAGALFMTIWLSGWTVGCIVLGLMVYAAWTGRNIETAVLLGIFAALFFIGEIMGIKMFVDAAGPAVPATLVLLAGINILFYQLLKAPTRAGRRLMDTLEGFRMYLSVAEQDRLELLNPPDRTPELFEKLLPYALALDVEQQWNEKFADILAQAEREKTYRPRWYSGRTSFSNLGSSLGSAFAGAVSSSTSAPGSSSGSGGGGSSGGGGGGGGGGGW